MPVEPDFLDEDTPISSQKFVILSYVLPKTLDQQPVVKVRGSFPTVEDCEKRIKRLQSTDQYFNMYVAEVGKWGSLLTNEQIRNQEIDTVYSNQNMNEIIQGYKENKDRADKEYHERKSFMEKKAREEGTVEGQKRLIEEISPMKVKINLENTAERIEKLSEEIEALKKTQKESLDIWSRFSSEEIEKSEKEFEEFKKTLIK